ncbi:MAG: P1 family peptidase [Ignavibacteriales bacterium]|nr:P1 family peptidase [Ignavibacteriales bacterium]
MKRTFVIILGLSVFTLAVLAQPTERPRLRDLGVELGVYPPGRYNAITDVADVLVGQVSLVRGDSVRTGVTAILPHGGNLFQEKVPAAVFVGNGFGKLVGTTQVMELGQIETPILLTSTLSVWDVADGIVDFMLNLPGNAGVRSVNPIVGETNDGELNDIRGRHVTRLDALEAIRAARTGPVVEGSVGAGMGTVCFGWKGGIGTSSRVLPPAAGGFTVGVLVQSNYGGVFEMAGVPLGKELGRDGQHEGSQKPGDGSCMIVVATDAPLNSQQLQRLAKRAPLALGRTGSSMSNGSGDYVIAFSSSREVRIRPTDQRTQPSVRFREDALSPLFQAVVEATEEAISNSLLRATTVRGYRGTEVEAVPVKEVQDALRKYGKIK